MYRTRKLVAIIIDVSSLYLDGRLHEIDVMRSRLDQEGYE